jgi:hypothetical protein
MVYALTLAARDAEKCTEEVANAMDDRECSCISGRCHHPIVDVGACGSMDSAWTGTPVARIVCFRSL